MKGADVRIMPMIPCSIRHGLLLVNLVHRGIFCREILGPNTMLTISLKQSPIKLRSAGSLELAEGAMGRMARKSFPRK
jgi:hypothetical protein